MKLTILGGGPAVRATTDLDDAVAGARFVFSAIRVDGLPCLVGAHGVTPLATAPLPGAMLGLLQQVKAVEQDTIEAGVTGSPTLALRAFAQHPLVDSVGVAEKLLAAYRQRLAGVAAVLGDR